MELTINIPDEVVEQARALGLTPESYVESLVHRDKPKAAFDRRAEDPDGQSETARSPHERVADMMRFIKDLSANSENIPVLPDYAFTRESFYSDYD